MKKIFNTLRPKSKAKNLRKSSSAQSVSSAVSNEDRIEEFPVNDTEGFPRRNPSSKDFPFEQIPNPDEDNHNKGLSTDETSEDDIERHKLNFLLGKSMTNRGLESGDGKNKDTSDSENSWKSEPSKEETKIDFDVKKFFNQSTATAQVHENEGKGENVITNTKPDPETEALDESKLLQAAAAQQVNGTEKGNKLPEEYGTDEDLSYTAENPIKATIDHNIERRKKSIRDSLSESNSKNSSKESGSERRAPQLANRSNSSSSINFDDDNQLPLELEPIQKQQFLEEESPISRHNSTDNSYSSGHDVPNDKDAETEVAFQKDVQVSQNEDSNIDIQALKTDNDVDEKQSFNTLANNNSEFSAIPLNNARSSETVSSIIDNDSKLIIEPHLKTLFKKELQSKSSEMNNAFNFLTKPFGSASLFSTDQKESSSSSILSMPKSLPLVGKERESIKSDFMSRFGKRYSDPVPLSTLLSNNPMEAVEAFRKSSPSPKEATIVRANPSPKNNRKLFLQTKTSCPNFNLKNISDVNSRRGPLTNIFPSSKENAIDDAEIDKVLQETQRILKRNSDSNINLPQLPPSSVSTSNDQIKNVDDRLELEKLEKEFTNNDIINPTPGPASPTLNAATAPSNESLPAGASASNLASEQTSIDKFMIPNEKSCCGGSSASNTSYRYSAASFPVRSSYQSGSIARYCDAVAPGVSDPQIIGDIIKDLHCVFEKTFGQRKSFETRYEAVQCDLDDVKCELDECENCRCLLEQEVIRLQGEIEATQQAFDEEVERRILLEGLVAQLKAQLSRLETLADSDAIEKNQLANCLKEAEMKLRELTNALQYLELERDQLLRNCRGFEELKERHSETINVSQGRCEQLEEALAKCCQANEDLQLEIARLNQEAKDFQIMEQQLRKEIQALSETLERVRLACAEERNRYERTIHDLKLAYEALMLQNQEVCQKMNEVVSAHHMEMDCLRKEAEKYKAFYECEKREREKLERALRDCEERKSQMIMQRMQPVDPCAEFEARYNQGPGSGGSGGSPNNGGTGNQNSKSQAESDKANGNTKTAALEKEVKQNKANLKEKTAALEKAQEEVIELKSTQATLEDELDNANSKIAELERNLQNNKTFLQEKTAAAAKSQIEIDKLKSSEKTLEELSTQLDTANENIAELETDLQHHKTMLKEKTELLKTSQTEIQKLKSLERSLDDLKMQLDKANANTAMLETDLEFNKTVLQDKATALEVSEKEIENMRNTEKALEVEIIRNREEISKLKGTNRVLQLNYDQIQNETSILQKEKAFLQANQNQNELKYLMDLCQQLKDEIKTERENVFKLKQKNDVYREQFRVAKDQLKNTVKDSRSQRIIEMDQQKVDYEKSLAKSQKRIEELASQVFILQSEKVNLEQELHNAKNALTLDEVTSSAIKEMRKRKEKLEKEIYELRKSINEKYVERSEVDRWKATYDSAIASLEARYDASLKKQLNDKVAEITTEIQRQSRDRLLIDEMRDANENALRNEHDQITSNLKAEINQLKRLVKGKEEEITTLKSSMTRLKEKYSEEATAKEELMKHVQKLATRSSTTLISNNNNNNEEES